MSSRFLPEKDSQMVTHIQMVTQPPSSPFTGLVIRSSAKPNQASIRILRWRGKRVAMGTTITTTANQGTSHPTADTVAAVIVTAAMSQTVRLILRVTDAIAEKQRVTEVTAETQRVTEVTVVLTTVL